MSDAFYVTTPIYYVNDKPHIGHAYTTIAADVLARYFRSIGRHAFFLTGVDEHGQKVEKAARALGVDPQSHCDSMAPRFSELWKKLRIEPDAFIRTTDKQHKKFVSDALVKLNSAGLIEARDFEGWYCTPCERYWTEKDVIDRAYRDVPSGTDHPSTAIQMEANLVGGNCPDCARSVEKLAERNYFFLMSRYAERIKAAIESDEMEILPKTRKNEILGFIAQGVGDLCISRPKSRLSWGIPLPFDPEYVTYVWFDALLNYVSGPEYLGKRREWWPAAAHLIGKDILTTHCVYWPAMLMALKLPLPRRIVAHGWWNFAGEKMSKSVGNVVDPVELIAAYGGAEPRAAIDAFRYFLMSEVTFGLDGTFSLEAYERRWTSDLSNDVGNLLSRVVSLIGKLCGGELLAAPTEDDRHAVEQYRAAMESFQFSRALEIALKRARDMNLAIQNAAPWSHPDSAPECLAKAAGALCVLSALLKPFMPDSADLMATRLGLPEAPALPVSYQPYRVHVTIGEPLFARPVLVDAAPATTHKHPADVGKHAEIKSSASTASATVAQSAQTGHVSIDDVKRLGLRVGVVESAERVEKTKKLLKLSVNMGDETRTLIAGIAETYAPETLIGRRVVVVSNLQPAVIRGIESRGMILCAATGESLALVSPLSEMPAGAEVR